MTEKKEGDKRLNERVEKANEYLEETYKLDGQVNLVRQKGGVQQILAHEIGGLIIIVAGSATLVIQP